MRIWIALAAALFVALGCPPNASRKPESVCVDVCVKRADDRCDRDGCKRGCALVLDRILENEHIGVIECVARRTGSATPEGAPVDEWRDGKCGEREWAECAALVGIHADGGPPAPPPVDEHPRD